jgi:hypothetical protein
MDSLAETNERNNKHQFENKATSIRAKGQRENNNDYEGRKSTGGRLAYGMQCVQASLSDEAGSAALIVTTASCAANVLVLSTASCVIAVVRDDVVVCDNDEIDVHEVVVPVMNNVVTSNAPFAPFVVRNS